MKKAVIVLNEVIINKHGSRIDLSQDFTEEELVSLRYSALNGGDKSRYSVKYYRETDKSYGITERQYYLAIGSKGNLYYRNTSECVIFYKDSKKIYSKVSTVRAVDKDKLWKRELLTHMGYEFTGAVPGGYQLLTDTLFKEIVRGKVTNPKSYVKRAFKISHQLDVPAKLLITYGVDIPWKMIASVLLSGKSVEVSIRNLRKAQTHSDLIQESRILGRKIDWSWSYPRLDNLHTEWSRDIMVMKRGALSTEPIWDIKEFNLLSKWGILKHNSGYDIVLLNTEQAIAEEGDYQHHCIYSVHYNKLKSKKYIAFSFRKGDKRATAEYYIVQGRASLQEISGRYNRTPDEEAVDLARMIGTGLTRHFLESKTPSLQEAYTPDWDDQYDIELPF